MSVREIRAIEVFVRAVELGSIRKAALSLGVSPQAASQALVQLEQQLGVRLLHRTTRNIALTDEGRILLESAQPALAALDRSLERVRAAKDEAVGPLRIAGPKSTFVAVLAPLLDEYCSLYPGVQPDVRLEDNIGDWVRDRVDVGFRIGHQPEDGVIARRLFCLQLIICATPDYLLRHGVPDSLAALAKHRCVGFRNSRSGDISPWYINRSGEPVGYEVAPTLSTNDAELEAATVLRGAAIGQLAGVTAVPLIRSGQLVPLLCEYVPDYVGIYIYYGNRTLPARVRAFVDMAIARLLNSIQYVLSAQELADYETAGRAVTGSSPVRAGRES